MYPILFEIPGLNITVTTFGLMVVLGFLVGSHLFTRIALRYEKDPEAARPRVDAVPVWILVGVIVGARAMYVAVEILRGSDTGKGFLADPLSILFVHKGGLVMYGGAFGAMLGGWWSTRRQGLRFEHLVDIGLTAGFLGVAIGRVGCLLVGDDYGSVVPENWKHLPFPFTITVPDPLPKGSLFGVDNAGRTLWATQVWMSANGLFLFLVGSALLRRRRYFGQVALKLLVLYSIARFAIEAKRGDEVRGLWFGDTVSTSQLISVAVGLFCAALLFHNRRRVDPGAAHPAAAGDDLREESSRAG